MTSFSVGVKTGRTDTTWYKITIWPDRQSIFDKIMPYLKKGSQIAISGDLKTPTTYTNKNQEVMINLEIHPSSICFVGSKEEDKAEQEIPF